VATQIPRCSFLKRLGPSKFPGGCKHTVTVDGCTRQGSVGAPVSAAREPLFCDGPESLSGMLIPTHNQLECYYGVATISRLLKMTGLFCKRAL